MTRRLRRAYSSAQVCRLAGVSYRTLDYWTRTHLITPSVREAAGSGSRRLYDDEDLAQVKLISALTRAAVPLQRIRRDGPEATLHRMIESLLVIAEERDRQRRQMKELAS